MKLDRLTSELNATKKEVDRLVKNKLLFYEVMSDMVFIFDKNYNIKDMNQTARNLLGDLRGSICYEALYDREAPCPNNCPIKLVDSNKKHEGCFEAKIGDMDIRQEEGRQTGFSSLTVC